MNHPDPATRVEQLLGPPGRRSAPSVHLGPDRCEALVALVLRAAPGARPRPEPWASSPNGLTLSVGCDFGLALGLNFPAGGQGGPGGGWVRSARPDGAVHWRIGRHDAARILSLLRRAARRARPAAA
jgi:hypothetical protein